MFDIFYNGEVKTVEPGSTVAQLLIASGVNVQFCAVELNESIVPRVNFDSQLLQPGDRVEVVTFVGGG